MSLRAGLPPSNSPCHRFLESSTFLRLDIPYHEACLRPSCITTFSGSMGPSHAPEKLKRQETLGTYCLTIPCLCLIFFQKPKNHNPAASLGDMVKVKPVDLFPKQDGPDQKVRTYNSGTYILNHVLDSTQTVIILLSSLVARMRMAAFH